MLRVFFSNDGLSITTETNEALIEVANDGGITFVKQNISFGIDGSINFPYGGVDAQGNWAFANAKINADGSGELAGGNITWDVNGNMNVASIT